VPRLLFRAAALMTALQALLAAAGGSTSAAVTRPPGSEIAESPLTLMLGSAVPVAGPINDVSGACKGVRGQTAGYEPETAANGRYVYDVWSGCGGIGFTRSADGGKHFSMAVTVPGSRYGAVSNSWDPAVAVARDGTLYVSFMAQKHQNGPMYPVVDVSRNHGLTFSRSASLLPPEKKNIGDRDFIAVAPDGAVYVTWAYGPNQKKIGEGCSIGGSCYYTGGDFTVIVQKSVDKGRTWSRATPVQPGFPDGGGVHAQLLAGPPARVDVVYLGHHVDRRTLDFSSGHVYFTSSVNGGQAWSRPVELGPRTGSVPLSTWWIDGSIGRDAAGNLYATWDSVVKGKDIGWLSYSADHGRHRSGPVRVTPDNDKAPHILAVAGGARGIAYVGWESDSSPRATPCTCGRSPSGGAGCPGRSASPGSTGGRTSGPVTRSASHRCPAAAACGGSPSAGAVPLARVARRRSTRPS
jgi:hypothetical protein